MASHRLHNREVIPSERKRAEQVLRQSEEKLRFMFEAIGEGITVTDLEGNIVEANEALLRMSGYSRKEELIGRNGLQFIVEKDRAKAIEDMMKAVDGGYGAAREYTFVDKDGGEFAAEASGSVLRDSTGNPAGFISVIRDITERKQADEALRESEEKLRVMFESISEGVVVTDLEGKIVDVNEALLRMSGLNREELIGQDGFGLMSDEDGLKTMDAGMKVLKGETRTERMRYEIAPTSGRAYDADLSVSVLRDSSGDPTGFVAIVRDITEHKRMEQAMRESEEKNRALVDHMEEGYLVFRGGRIRFANRRCAEVIGIPVEKLIGENYWRFLAPESQEQARQTYETLTGGGKVPPIQEYVYLTEDGRRIPIEASMREITYEGKPSYAVVLRDIAERKRAEEALRESEGKYRFLYEGSSAISLIFGMDGRIADANRAAQEAFGYSKDEYLGMDALEFITPEHREKAAMLMERSLRDEYTPEADIDIYAKDGSTRTILLTSGQLVLYEKDQPTGILISGVDITERKRAEEALRESEEKYRTVLEDIEDGYFEVDIAGNFTFFNDPLCGIIGYSRDEMMGMNNRQYMDKENAKKVYKAFNRVYTTGKTSKEFGWEIIRKDGTKRFTEASVSLKRNSEGELIGFRGIVRDITERKWAEEALQESQEKIRNLFESVTDGIFAIDLNGAYTEANERMLEMHGFSSKDEILGENAFEFVAPDIDRTAMVNMKRALEQGSVASLEYTVVRTDGSEFPAEVNAKMLKDASGNPVGFIGIVRDITEHKQAEEALRKSEEHYRLLAENATDVIFTMDMDLHYTYISPSVTSLRGYSAEEVMPQSIEQTLTPESFEVAMKTWAEELATENMEQKDLLRSRVLELEMRCKDGSTVWTEVKLTSLRDPDGQAVGIQGVTRDITERRRAEDALRKSEEQFRSLIENAQDAIVILNPDITIRYQSPSMERMMGRKAEDRIGKNPSDFCHPDDITKVTEAFLQLLENKIAIVHTELRLQHKDGSWRTFEVVGNNLIDDPAMAGIVLNMRDITERKQAEEEIRRLNEELEQRVVERTRQLQAVNKELEAFAYSVSHDLRAPLRSIDGFSQVLLEDYTDKLDDEGKNYLQRVRSASQRMAQLIDDLLNLSRLTRGKMRYETVDLSALAQTIAMELQQSQPERDVAFTIALGLVAKGDAHLLQVALENLLGNSWKFAKKRGRVRIEFGYAETNGQPAYFVRDNGVGFDMAYADKLFGAFQRLHSHSEFEGAGIGLATVQRIIHRHGGDIWAESAVGQGATFYFTL